MSTESVSSVISLDNGPRGSSSALPSGNGGGERWSLPRGCCCPGGEKFLLVIVLTWVTVIVCGQVSGRSLSSWKMERLDPFGEVFDHIFKGKKRLVAPFWLDDHVLVEKGLESHVIGVYEKDT